MHISWRKYNIRNPHTSTFTCRIIKNKSLTTWAVNHLTRNGFPNHKTSLHIYFGYIIFMNCNYQNKGRVPTPKWMLPNGFFVLMDTAYPGFRQDRHFLFLVVPNSMVKKMETAQSPFPSTITSIYYIQVHHSYVLCKAHLQISADVISQFYPIIVLVIKLFS